MNRAAPEPVQVVKQRRDAALSALVSGVPYIAYLGVTFDRRGDELTAVLPFREDLIGNPFLQAIHGGVTAAFLEVTAMVTLNWTWLWGDLESGALDLDAMAGQPRPALRAGHRAFPDAARPAGLTRAPRHAPPTALTSRRHRFKQRCKSRRKTA